MTWIQGLSDWLLGNAGQWWAYAITFVLTFVDGFFPPLPSESIVIAMAAMALHHEQGVNLWLLAPGVLGAAWLGDQTAYLIGKVVPLRRWLSRWPRMVRALDRAEDLLERKGPEVLVSARFIPGYRVGINMTAGGVGYPWRTFALIDVAAVLVWAVFGIGIGVGASAVFQGRPLLSVVVGVCFGLVVGWIIDRLSRLRHR